MEAGVSPIEFWDMTPADIMGQIKGYRDRARWQAVQTYLVVSCWSKEQPSLPDMFPGLFDDLKPKQSNIVDAIKARIMAHSEDYKRNRVK